MSVLAWQAVRQNQVLCCRNQTEEGFQRVCVRDATASSRTARSMVLCFCLLSRSLVWRALGERHLGEGGKHQKGGSVCLEDAKVNKEHSDVTALLTPSESHTGKRLVLSMVILVSY